MSNTAPILVPVDGSESAKRAAAFAASLASQCNRRVLLVGVLDLVQLDPEAGFYVSDEQLGKLRERFDADVLDHHRHALKGVDVDTERLEGPVSKRLLEFIDEKKPFMVIVGRTGKGAMERLFQGSVSRALTAESSVPVTTVP